LKITDLSLAWQFIIWYKILLSYQCIPKGFIESLGSPHSLQVDWFFKFGNIGKSECHLSDNYKVNDTFKPSLSEYINVFMKHKKLCFNKFTFANFTKFF